MSDFVLPVFCYINEEIRERAVNPSEVEANRSCIWPGSWKQGFQINKC